MKTTLTATSLILLFLFSLTSPMATVLSEGAAADRTTGRSTACSGYVCINEVIPNPNGWDDAAYPNGEWLELYNQGTVDVDLTGWKVTNQRFEISEFQLKQHRRLPVRKRFDVDHQPGRIRRHRPKR